MLLGSGREQKMPGGCAVHVFYADWMDNKEIEDTWPNKTTSITPWDRLDEGNRPQNADLQFLYKDTDTDFEKHKDQSLVIQYQCYWREAYYRVLDPATNQLVSFDAQKYGKIRKAYKDATGQDLQAVKQMRRVYYRGFYCGRTELEYKKSPYQDGFTFKFITAKRDRNRKQWYGIVRPMIDPQKWANKVALANSAHHQHERQRRGVCRDERAQGSAQSRGAVGFV
jgi:hypothetical protein